MGGSMDDHKNDDLPVDREIIEYYCRGVETDRLATEPAEWN
jgi:hypothetical protein